ncbi:Multi antimicrobial extrusion protein [Cynara cardunculus var. scolymus]|uniref:Protein DETOXIFICATION n=1 Tax=Cynara cardunculus var. scolymus TaxID=59895 RepID=A0A118K0G1_CYNCS|nr:Multi antimicrobial extrusion protein [Cynara cardunculus var. scolymus]
MAEGGVVLQTQRERNLPIFVFFKDLRLVLKMDALGKEILFIAVPAAMALAADPLASLIDTAFIGRIGPVEIAAVGVSIAIFNQVSKVAIFPLVSITTSFVAEEESLERMNSEAMKLQNTEKASTNKQETRELTQDDVNLENLENGSTEEDQIKGLAPENGFKTSPCKHMTSTDVSNKSKLKKLKRNIPSASTALLLGAILGLLETLLLVLLAEPFLSLMGVKSGSPMLLPAHKYLTLRALGAPAVLLSLAMQGVFRGFKDTRTPLYATGDVANIILDPILIFVCNLGVSGAAIAHVLNINNSVSQIDATSGPTTSKRQSFAVQPVIAATICVTLAASLAARLGATPMAAFQICLQVWLTSSLLADGLAVAGQAIIASSFAEKNYEKATATAARFVAGTQPINSIAFVFDGVNFGASDFAYSAYSMILVAIGSIGSLFVLFQAGGFLGIWVALSIFMGLRAIAGIWRMGTGTGPWSFLRK